MGDSIYTPSVLATKMVSLARVRSVHHVADFAAGDGQLLRAARLRWPESRCIATDVSASAVASLRRKHPDWTAGQCNFLVQESRKRCRAITGFLNRLPLILLNPPFSCRGAMRHSAMVDGEEVPCSPALAFVLTAMAFLRDRGELVAVLPAGCLRSEKDRFAWTVIRRTCMLEVLAANGHRTFEGCFPKTVLVRVTRNAVSGGNEAPSQSVKPNGNAVPVGLVRGSLPMHSSVVQVNGRWPLVHTTDLRPSSVQATRRIASGRHRMICGPAVLVPRVGEPSRENLTCYRSKRRVVLSDCVIGLTCSSVDDAVRLHTEILTHWDSFCDAYGGTCARYITIGALIGVLRRIGFEASVPSQSVGAKSQCGRIRR